MLVVISSEAGQFKPVGSDGGNVVEYLPDRAQSCGVDIRLLFAANDDAKLRPAAKRHQTSFSDRSRRIGAPVVERLGHRRIDDHLRDVAAATFLSHY